jgi:Fur family transcriptional regulator, ferric uptake regulator
MTRRDDVVAGLREAGGFVSAQALHAQICATGTRIGLATIYRTLSSLTESGEIDTVRGADGEVTYRACDTTEHHHHLTCRECGHTVELNAETVETWASAVTDQYGFTAVDHTVEITGRCFRCTRSAPASGH